MLRVLGLILARGGSKGVPRKNIRMLAGRPLIAYTADAALSSRNLHRIIVSTDDEEIAAVARRCGLDVPFLRPDDLARDETPSLPVVRHAVDWLARRGETFDAVCQLQPTSPLRQQDEIDRCIEFFAQRCADCVMTLRPVPDEWNPHWVYFQQPDGTVHLATGEDVPIPRRQLLPRAYSRDGSVYVTRREVIVEHDTLYGSRVFGIVIDDKERVNIDTLEDFAAAERIVLAGRHRADRTTANGAV
jgi:CMP-N-acetylneuraminic acid synthetase